MRKQFESLKQSTFSKGMWVVSPTSSFANDSHANVSGQFANVWKSVRKRLEVSSETLRTNANVPNHKRVSKEDKTSS